MKITRVSKATGIERTMDILVTQEQIDTWKAGALIRRAMPQLTQDQRKFMLTGMTSEEWDYTFNLEEEDHSTDDEEPAF